MNKRLSTKLFILGALLALGMSVVGQAASQSTIEKTAGKSRTSQTTTTTESQTSRGGTSPTSDSAMGYGESGY